MTRYPESIWDLPLEYVGPTMDYLDELQDTTFDIEVEGTHAVFDQHGYDPATTPLDKLFANQAMGFDMAGAMNNG